MEGKEHKREGRGGGKKKGERGEEKKNALDCPTVSLVILLGMEQPFPALLLPGGKGEKEEKGTKGEGGIKVERKREEKWVHVDWLSQHTCSRNAECLILPHRITHEQRGGKSMGGGEAPETKRGKKRKKRPEMCLAVM